MSSKRSFTLIAIALMMVVASALACNLPITSTQAPPAAATVENGIETAATAASQGPISLTLTEGQLNSLIQSAIQADPRQTIQNLQLRLQEGQIAITGTVNQEGLSLPLRLSLSIIPDGQGSINFDIVAANVGPLPLPENMQGQIETLINQNLKSQVQGLTNNMYIESLTIGDGVLVVTGRLQ